MPTFAMAETIAPGDALAEKKKRQIEVSQLAYTLADPVQIQSIADITKRKVVFAALKDASDAMRPALEHLRENMAERIQTAALDAKNRGGDGRTQIRVLLKEDRANSQYLKRMRADSAWAKTILQRLKIMKDYWGKWRTSEDGKSIISADPEFVEGFEMLTRRANAIQSMRAFEFGGLPANRAPAIPDYSHVLSAVTGYWNDDANPDRAVLLERNPEPSEQELIFSELFIYLSDPESESMQLALHKMNPAWSGELAGTLPHLELDGQNRLVIHSQNDAIGRNHWQKTLTVAYINQSLVIAAFSLLEQDTINPDYHYACTFNLLTGHGKKNGKAFTVKVQTLLLSDWTDEWVPVPCNRRKH